jgi:phosphatidylserine/phosphatidylglycerophosphate/cardiolipin synthase-like enzyme
MKWLGIIGVVFCLIGGIGGCATTVYDLQNNISHVPVVEANSIQANQISSYFSRVGDHPEAELISLYDRAQSSIDVASYSLTYPSIIKALTDAKKRGVKVRVITDRIQTAGKTQRVAVDDLLLNGIVVKNNHFSGLMHLKMSVVDGAVATTGSYNYTKNATEQNEEMLVIITEPNFIQRCNKEFERMWGSSDYLNTQMSY